MSASLIAALLGLLCISLIEKTNSLDVFRESKESFNSVAISKFRASDSASANPRIVNGSNATMNEYPWMVAVFTNNVFQCGGSIITNQFILTAAHCVKGKNTEDVIVSLGDHILNNESETKSQNYQIEEIITHEKYFSDGIGFNITSFQNVNFNKVYNDVALLKVNGNIEYSENVSPICLSKSEEKHMGKIATVTGWGTTENNQDSEILKEAQVRVIDYSECRMKTGWINTTSLVSLVRYNPTLCAAEVTGFADVGDSGGPLVIKNKNNKWEQIGIVCCRHPNFESPTIYVRVNSILKWIESKTGRIDRSNC